MAITPAAFLTGVSGLIRVGRELQDAYIAQVMSDDYKLLLPSGMRELTRGNIEELAATALERDEVARDGRFAGLLKRDEQLRVWVFDRTKSAKREELLQWYVKEVARLTDGDDVTLGEGAVKRRLPISPVVVLTHRAWISGDDARSRRARLGRAIAGAALDVLAIQPDLLGLGKRSTAIVEGVAANLDLLVDDDQIADQSAPRSLGERLLQVFAQSAIETVAERPELFVSGERWRPVVQGMLVPLKEQLELTPNAGLEIFAHDRLRQLLRGPIAHSVLTSLSADTEELLGRRFGDDTALGAVTRIVLGAVANPAQGRFDLAEVFSERGVATIYDAALQIAQTRPELFVAGDDAGDVAQRQLLSRIAATLDNAPRPYNLRAVAGSPGIAAQVACVALEVAAAHATTQLRQAGDPTRPRTPESDVAAAVVQEVMTGLGAVLSARTRADQRNAIERLFSPDQAVDLLRVIALRVAETPGMLVGQGASEEVRNIVAGVAHALAEDTAGLLDGEDWRAVLGAALELAAENPGALFSIKTTAAPEHQVATALIAGVLRSAAANMKDARGQIARGPGSILFGRTLREAIAATLKGAASNLLTLANPIEGHEDRSRLDAHVSALEQFIAMLLELAKGGDRALRMSAAEWLYVYRTFVAHVIMYGPAALGGEASDDPDIVVITPERVLALLLDRKAQSSEEDVE